MDGTRIDAAVAAAIVQGALPRLKQLVRSGIDQKEPSASIWRRSGRTTVFDGSYDFHSCIAAHWAGLSMARHTGDSELAAGLLARLSPAHLEAERALFASMSGTPDAATNGGPRVGSMRQMFLPYVDAWLLLLLTELQHHDGGDNGTASAFRRDTVQRLLQTLEQQPFPEAPPSERRPQPMFLGNYRSWLFAYLVLRLCDVHRGEQQERFQALATARFEPAREALLRQTARQPSDFFDVRALHAVLVGLDAPALAAQVEHGAAARFTPLPQAVTLRTVHPVGACASEAWPLAVAGRVDPEARAAFLQHTASILQRTELWADDFAVVSHWMPQFLWFGLWLLHEGRPGEIFAPLPAAAPVPATAPGRTGG